MGDVPDILLNMFLSSSPGIRNHMNLQVGAPDPVIWRGGFTDPLFPQSYWTILNKQELIIRNSVTWLVQYSLSTLPIMSTIYDKPGALWNIWYWWLLHKLLPNEWNGWCGLTRKKSTTPQQFEEDHITLTTMRHIKPVCSKSNERKFVIQCVMDE